MYVNCKHMNGKIELTKCISHTSAKKLRYDDIRERVGCILFVIKSCVVENSIGWRREFLNL